MSTKFYCINEIKNANVSASSENAQFPLSNLNDPRRSKVYRSLSNSDNIVFDFGYPSKIDSVMMVDDSMTGNKLLSCTVYLDNDPAFGSAVTQVMEIDPVHGFSFANFEAISLMRYMKIVMTSTAGFCEISKLFAGAKIELADEVDFSLPFSFTLTDNATVTTNKFGQDFIDEINTRKKINGSFKALDKNELDGILEIVTYAGRTRPFWVQFDAILNNPNQLSGYYKLSSNQQSPSLDSSLHWSMSFDLIEAL